MISGLVPRTIEVFIDHRNVTAYIIFFIPKCSIKVIYGFLFSAFTMKKICIIGLGYIGLPTAAILATSGHEIIGVDINENARRNLIEGNPYSEEPKLQDLLEKARSSGRLSVSETPVSADVFIICVPTPFKDDKKADLSYIESACANLVPHLKKGDLVILESTVPPSTTKEVVCGAIEKAGFSIGEDILVAFCPERVMPGKIVRELVENDRIIGGIDKASGLAAKEIYDSFCTGTLFITDATTAEFVKLIENTYRDTNIALANQLAVLAEKWKINVWEAIKLANQHPRVNILNPGPGVGGHCIAVDPYFLIQDGGEGTEMIEASRIINNRMPEHVMSLIKNLAGPADNTKITIFGVAYKNDIEDTRESPSLEVIDLASKAGYDVAVYDPVVGDKYPGRDLESAIKDSECIIIATDHTIFKELDPSMIGVLMKSKKVLDTRNCLEHDKWADLGFEVMILGKGN